MFADGHDGGARDRSVAWQVVAAHDRERGVATGAPSSESIDDRLDGGVGVSIAYPASVIVSEKISTWPSVASHKEMGEVQSRTRC
jgi:hypothetical protein